MKKIVIFFFSHFYFLPDVRKKNVVMDVILGEGDI